MDEKKNCCIEIEPGTIVKILGQPVKLNQSVFCTVPENFIDSHDIMDDDCWPDQGEVGL